MRVGIGAEKLWGENQVIYTGQHGQYTQYSHVWNLKRLQIAVNDAWVLRRSGMGDVVSCKASTVTGLRDFDYQRQWNKRDRMKVWGSDSGVER